MPTSNKRKRNKNPPTELNWVIKNQEQLSHITFFDFFQTYTRHTVTRRFRFVVEYYFNENKKNELFNQYNQWKKTGAAKIYWQQREAARSDGFSQMIQFRPDENTSTSETSAVDTEVTSSDVTSFTPEEITTVCTSEISIDEATSSISSTIRQPGENNCHVVNAAISLLTLPADQNKFVTKIILTVKRLIEDLPEEVPVNTINEFELCSRYLQAALQPMFDDSSEHVVFRWTNTICSEYKETDLKLLKKRPDGCITVTEENNREKNVGFTEVKPAVDRRNHYKVNLDLYRLSIFSKEAIDTNKLSGVLSIQAVGNWVTFYITQLKGDGLYLMTELEHLRFPLSLNELPQLLGFVDRLYNILCVFEQICLAPVDVSITEEKGRETIKSPVLRPFIVKTVNRNRVNCFEHYHH
ncbi:hypothetical protein HPULCUR_000957 [Helicostylum pulchrum]|uniref:Uncharacterized protein n=1 Tax=Helicostylum pulchrum TaxID=562976 RepID=A0ABP9XLF5_9FUNG